VNIDPTSNRHGEIVAWDSLTDAEQKSGSWIKLPTHDENGQPVMARRQSLMERLHAQLASRDTREERIREMEAQMRLADATARPLTEQQIERLEVRRKAARDQSGGASRV
jgi:hypothetical protein